MVTAILKLPLVVVFPHFVFIQSVLAVAPVIGIVAVPGGVLRIPGAKAAPFVAGTIVIAEIIVMGIPAYE
ncbi:hypothetical protein JCM39068_09320 [Desulfocastanea catecholica]